MGKLSTKIEINYKDTTKKADQMLELASRLERVAENEIEGIHGMAVRVWSGEAGDRYRQKIVRLKAETMAQARYLRFTAESMKISAEAIHRAEQEALSLIGIKR